ncbi:MAG: hypothetical protein KKF43_05190, partial [Proteobacteria bacterium]|nr:hypothetical protein [Pseudomonadota bacterium]
MPKNPKTKFPMDIFLGQIAKIKKEFGLNRKKFENAIGMKNTGRWGKEVKSVELDTLRIISERFNKSLDWLLKEENEADTLEVF